jgi:hypothetical protein
VIELRDLVEQNEALQVGELKALQHFEEECEEVQQQAGVLIAELLRKRREA